MKHPEGEAANTTTPAILAAIFFGISLVFVYRSFYGMRIGAEVR